jgi:hypothetical protein
MFGKSISCIFIFSFTINKISFSQQKIPFKTTSYLASNEWKVVSTYSNEMKLISEEYFNADNNSKIITVEYNTQGNLSKFIEYGETNVIFSLDYENGVYNDYLRHNYFRFYGNFIFHGIQKGGEYICNYSNGLREGLLYKIDSIVTGSRKIIVKRPNIYLLQKNIIQYYNSIEEEYTYSKYQSILMQFKKDLLHGSQKILYSPTKNRFLSEFYDSKLISHTAYELDNSILTRIHTSNGIIDGNYISNGRIVNNNESTIFYIPSFIFAGKIIRSEEYDSSGIFTFDENVDDMPERSDLLSISNNSDESQFRKWLYNKHKIPIFYMVGLKIPKVGDFNIHSERFSKYTINNFTFCKDEFILSNISTLKVSNLRSFFVKNFLKYYTNYNGKSISILSDSIYNKNRTQDLASYLGLALKVYERNLNYEKSKSEKYDFMYDSTKVFIENEEIHQYLYKYLSQRKDEKLCFKISGKTIVSAKPLSFYIEDNNIITEFEYSINQYPYLLIILNIYQREMGVETPKYHFVKNIKYSY